MSELTHHPFSPSTLQRLMFDKEEEVKDEN